MHLKKFNYKEYIIPEVNLTMGTVFLLKNPEENLFGFWELNSFQEENGFNNRKPALVRPNPNIPSLKIEEYYFSVFKEKLTTIDLNFLNKIGLAANMVIVEDKLFTSLVLQIIFYSRQYDYVVVNNGGLSFKLIESLTVLISSIVSYYGITIIIIENSNDKSGFEWISVM
jgi:hypothetical protein